MSIILNKLTILPLYATSATTTSILEHTLIVTLFRRTLNLVNSIESKEESINPITTNDEEYTMSSITPADANTRTILHTRIIISNID